MVVVVADASNLKRNLLVCTQIIDLKMPVVIALTMMDLAKKKGIKIDIADTGKRIGSSGGGGQSKKKQRNSST